jgi:hypothetical protein
VGDNLVFIDDFIGTGNTVYSAWENGYAELVPGIGKVYLIVVAAVEDGRKLVNDKTTMTCVPAHELSVADNFFADENKQFSKAEKASVLAQCRRAMKKSPKGYGDYGLVLIFQHRCPNNSLPVLHADYARWIGQ